MPWLLMVDEADGERGGEGVMGRPVFIMGRIDARRKLESTADNDSTDFLVETLKPERGIFNSKAFPLIVAADAFVLLGYQVYTSLDETNNCTLAEFYTIRVYRVE